jgi:pimeloyl-ACP methyl ester carboxylesterase
MSRRAVLTATAGGIVVLGGGALLGGEAVLGRVQRLFADEGPAGVIPDVPEGDVRLAQVRSAARSREVGFWTAVPDGHGSGEGLPVVLILHGASATTADYSAFGLGRFLTAAVRDGVPPFVLAGADGGRTLWEGDGPGSADDPQRMLAEEIPAWCEERGFDTSRVAAYGWSMGGYGALRAAELRPDSLLGVAALSPAVAEGDAVFGDASLLDPERTGLWCGESDGFVDDVRALAEVVDPAIAAWDLGAHTRAYWNRVTPDAFRFLGGLLEG